MASTVMKTGDSHGDQGASLPANTPSRVQFRRSSSHNVSVSLTSDELDEQGFQNLWQAYALGGFLVVRWLWARWRSSRDSTSAAGSGED